MTTILWGLCRRSGQDQQAVSGRDRRRLHRFAAMPGSQQRTPVMSNPYTNATDRLAYSCGGCLGVIIIIVFLIFLLTLVAH